MIVITGGSGALGRELTKLYKNEGKTVVNVSRTSSELADHNLLHNLREGSEILAAAKEVEAISEPIEALINCAGVFTAEPLGKITEEEIKRTMATNLKAPMLMVSSLIERIKKDGADIVNVSSIAGTRGAPGIATYAASKWALRGFSATLQAELREYPCRVISFCPASFESEIVSKATGKDNGKGSAERMSTRFVAKCLKQLLDLPKDMEITEIVVNRKIYND